MIIVPSKRVDNTDPEVLPIHMVVENRMDIMAVFLRVLRYISSVGALGDNLCWDDSDKSPIYIADYASATEFASEVNPLPAMLLRIGGYGTGDRYMGHSMVDSSQEGTSRLDNMSPGLQIAVRGRNKTETYFLSDKLTREINTLRPAIIASALNMEYMSGINVGEVSRLNDTSGNPYIWECMLSFSVSVDTYMFTTNYPGISPDPRLNKGLFMGLAGSQEKEDPSIRRPLFSYADFVLQSGTPEDGFDYTVSTRMIFDDESGEAEERAFTTKSDFEVSVSGDPPAAIPGTKSDPVDVTVSMITQGPAEFEMTLPEGFAVAIPGVVPDSAGKYKFKLEKK